MTDYKIKIGTKFKTRGKHPKLCTVVDIYRTYNNAGNLVRVRYVTQHIGPRNQPVLERDVVRATIAIGLIND